MKLTPVHEFNVIKKYLFNEEYDKAINELRRLHKIYPDDKNVLFELASILLRQGINISEALYTFALIKDRGNKNSIENEIGSYYLRNGDFEKAEESFKTILTGNPSETETCYGLHGLIKIYVHQDKWEDALRCFDRLVKVSELADYKLSHFSNIRFLLLYKNNYINGKEKMDNYFERQLVDYDKNETINHIKRHLEKLNPDGTKFKTFHSVFSSETNIEELYDYVLEKINDINPSSYDLVDYYKVDINEKIGETYSNKETKCVEVVTVPNTKQILSIYPVLKNHINKSIREKEEPKKKTYKYKKYNKKNHK